jgi:hypothetical protein
LLSIVLLVFASSPSISQQALPLHDQIWGELRVALIDHNTGRAVSARCYLTDASQQSWIPSGAITYLKPPEHNFIAQTGFRIELPPGSYRLVVEKGPEYLSERREIKVPAGETLNEKIELSRWTDMNALGWFSGDLHNHRDWHEMPQILLSEDLNLAPTLSTWVWEFRPILGISLAKGPAIRYADATHAYSVFDTEIERLGPGPGAVCLIGLRSPVQFHGYLLSPPSTQFCELAHRQGGYVDAEKITWRDSPVLIALQQVDSVGLVYNSFSPHGVEMGWGVNPPEGSVEAGPAGAPLWALDIYYKFLNCGFRLPVSAGTASGVKPTPLGYDRVYVHMPQKFTYPGWFEALKAGRSFATNGPMLFFTVNGQEPGSEIRIPEASGGSERLVKLKAEASSANELERLEIIWKGEVIKSVTAPPHSRRLQVNFDVQMNGSGWFAARAFEQPTASVRFAHTSPVYIRVGSDRGVVPADAQFFISWLDREIKSYEGSPDFRSPADRDAILATFRSARDVYERLAQHPDAQ